MQNLLCLSLNTMMAFKCMTVNYQSGVHLKKGPCKDMMGMLKNEVEKNNLVFTASSHRIEHYWFMGGMRETESDIPEKLEYGDFYWPSYIEPFENYNQEQIQGFEVETLFMQDWLVRTCEIVDKYRPRIVYFDWWIQVEAAKPYLKKFNCVLL